MIRISHRFVTWALASTILAWCVTCASAEEPRKAFFVDLVQEVKKAVVFVGRTDQTGRVQLHATACLLSVDGYYHLLTAKHVLFAGPAGGSSPTIDDQNIVVLLNRRDGSVAVRPIQQIKKDHRVEWIFHPPSQPDGLAVLPFPIDPKGDDIKSIPESLFFGPEGLYELYDVFFLSFQPGIDPGKHITPVIRKGTISVQNTDGTFFIDGFSFPGNSGSPVFLTPAPIRFDNSGNISVGGDTLGGRFVGIVGGYLPYQEVAISSQTGRPRVVFEENTGLSIVWPAKLIKELLQSHDFQVQLAHLKGK
jgi:hypothetical protein